MGSTMVSERPIFSPDEEQTLRTLTCVCASLSAACSLWIMASVIAFGRWRLQTHVRYVFMLSLASAVNSASYLLGHPQDRGLCVAQGTLLMAGSSAEKGWVLVMAIALYRALCANQDPDGDQQASDQRAWVYSCAGVAAFTAVMTLLPFIGDSYGDAGLWCWIEPSHVGTVWRFLSYGV